jgi:hypothetical protein
MSSDRRPEVFFDRSLGKVTAQRLRERGWVVHLIAEYYPDDAADIQDEEWIAEGCSRGWILLTKDKRIRYRTAEREALQKGHLFCLASGSLSPSEMTERFSDAERSIMHAVLTHAVGFWHVYADGQLRKMWP